MVLLQDQSVTISVGVIKKTLTTLINEYIMILSEPNVSRIELDIKLSFVRGQLDITTALMQDKWNDRKSSYVQYLIALVEKYSLDVDLKPLLIYMHVHDKKRKYRRGVRKRL